MTTRSFDLVYKRIHIQHNSLSKKEFRLQIIYFLCLVNRLSNKQVLFNCFKVCSFKFGLSKMIDRCVNVKNLVWSEI